MPKSILAIASKGGHWEQLMLLRPALEDANVIFACTDPLQGRQFDTKAFVQVFDYSRSEPLKVLVGGFQMYRLIKTIRPDCIISTGAAPGIVALSLGRLFRIKTIWIDSIANSQEMSLSGKIASKIADITLTQWEHLVGRYNCQYWGAVL